MLESYWISYTLQANECFLNSLLVGAVRATCEVLPLSGKLEKALAGRSASTGHGAPGQKPLSDT